MSGRRWRASSGTERRPRALLLVVIVTFVTIALGATAVSAAGPPVVRTGRLAGPVAVHGGSSPRTVARLRLEPGSWSVVARGVLRNTTADATAHPVTCRLALGGSSDQVLASPKRRDVGNSRQSFVLIQAAHLDGAERAILKCAAPGSLTGDIVVEDIRVVAFRTAALGIERELSSAVFYGNADAISQGRLLKGHDALVPSDTRTVARLSLPAGHWAITAKATVRHPTDTEGSMRCFLTLGDWGAIVGDVTGTGTPGDHMPIALELVHSSGSAFEARLECQDLSHAGTTAIRDIRLLAYRARAVEQHELAPGATFGPTPGWVRPVVYGATETENPALVAGRSYRTINRLSLPAGSWVVVATGMMSHAGAGRASVDCRIGHGRHDGVRLRLGAGDTVGGEQPFAIAWAGSFGERRAVRFQCRSDASQTGLFYLKYVAYKAGTLRTGSLR